MTMAAPPRQGARRVVGLLRVTASLVISAVLLVGVPLGLQVIAGNPLDRLPDLLAGDMSSGVLLAVLAAVLWAAWAQFVVAFVVELVSAIRRAPIPARIAFPGFGVQQGLARALISGALMLGSVATTTVAPAAAVMAMPPAAAAVTVNAAAAHAPAVAAKGSVLTLTTDGPRTWWDLADAHLGDGTQWKQLWSLNDGRVQADGTTLRSATTLLQPGWTVQLPAGATVAATADATPTDVTVEPGQTLSEIAQTHGRDWQDLWSANSGRVQPDGGVLSDPDYVEPGWTITIPTPSGVSAQTPAGGHDAVTVRPGDTLSDIAAAHGTDLTALMEANGGVVQADGGRLANPDVIESGWVLQIPDTATQPAAPAAVTPTIQPAPPDEQPPTTDAADAAPSAAPQVGPGIGMPSANPGGAPTIVDGNPTAVTPTMQPAPPDEQPPTTDAADAAPSAAPQVGPGIGMPSANPGGASAVTDATPAAPSTTAAPTGADLVPSGQVSGELARAGQDESSSMVSPVAVFSGAGALLAALMLAALMRRRARQRSYRRPGELSSAYPDELVDVERALRAAGGAAAADAQWLDEALHGLGQLTSASGENGVLPDVVAVAVSATELRLVLAEPSTATVGAWQVREDGRQWVLARQADTGYDAQTRGAAMPPYPTLVTVGESDAGEHWLLDLERIGSLTLTGDPVRSANLARFMAAELAHNSWSELLQVTLVGIGSEMAPMYPERLTYAQDPELTLTSAAAQLRGVERSDTAVLDGRTALVGGEAFAAHVVLVDPAAVTDRGALDGLMTAVAEYPDRATVALVVTQGADSDLTGRQAAAWDLHVDQDGTLTIPPLGLQVRAQQLPQAEAGLLTQMMAMAAGPGRWTRPATTPHVVDGDVTTLPIAVDESVATTRQEQQALIEPVPAEVREQIVAGDSDLDADLAQWTDPTSTWPRISILGEVDVRPKGSLTKRKLPALRAEVAVHLAVHSAGVTAERLSSDLWPMEATIHGSRLRQQIYELRGQFGVNPRTGTEYLPRSEDAGRLYRLDDVLIDGELFRRLRLRASIRDNQQLRIQDWWAALDLVRGIPFSGAGPSRRREGYAWLADQHVDEEYRSLIVDLAHEVATHHLAVGEPDMAEKAARRALTAFDAADPAPDICLLDLIWACDAQGRRAEGDSYVKRIIANHGGTEIEDCPPRTFELLDRRQQQQQAA